MQSNRTHNDSKGQADRQQEADRRERESSFVDATRYTSHLYLLIIVVSGNSGFTLSLSLLSVASFSPFFKQMCALAYETVRVSVLSDSSFLRWFESFLRKRDSPINGRLIKWDFIVLLTVIEERTTEREKNVFLLFFSLVLPVALGLGFFSQSRETVS